MRRLPLAVIALVLAGCSPATSPPAASTSAPPPIPTSQVSTPAPSAPGSPSGAPPPSALTSPAAPTPSAAPAGPPTAPPPAPTAPAPSTAGALTEDDVARPDGWEPTARPGSYEEGYLGNGTWVHATSAPHSAYAAIALGCAEVGPYPEPVAALEGTLADDEGRPGVGLTLEFAAEADAAGYFAEWVRQAEACEGLMTERISLDADTWLGRRTLDTVWSEATAVRGSTVRLLIVGDPTADLSGVF